MKKSKAHTVRLTEAEATVLDGVAAERGVAPGRFVEELVVEGLQRRMLERAIPSDTEDLAATERSLHLIEAGTDSGLRGNIDWDDGRLRFSSEERRTAIERRGASLEEARRAHLGEVMERHGIQIDDDPEYEARGKAALQQAAKIHEAGRLKPREAVIIDGFRVSTDPTDREVLHGPSNPAIWNPDTEGEA